MRKLLAATAALSCALLLASCASPTDPASDDTATTPATETTTEAAPEVTPTVVAVTTTCNTFYSGEYSAERLVTETTPLLATPDDETAAAAIYTTRERLAAVQNFADPELQQNLNGIKAPFEAAVQGETINTSTLQDSLDAFRAQCVEAGYAFAS
ncbi:hypothetical protein [Cellulosimicrobium protaetiae]|uniref:Lipoprotein n=1 Tax=Cellulosimicrobium protaetiae TaxID=2587808 RepID=A0A6M5U8Z9_9MICO|nr:hypothetical protein [Cellulosimicrobium protaetiae]QJW34966.1 hypothetical protein FIC82_000860 [Cellulosimicrobium protaetiae]